MRYFVSAGEPSGDMHLAFLVKNIKLINKNAEFFGAAGSRSEKEGVKVLQDIKELAIMGFKEVFGKYFFLRKKANDYLDFIVKNDIKNVIMVDYGGFNLAFAKLLKKNVSNIKIFYYIPPKLWVWGEWRIKKLALSDHILVIFPWEVDFYKKYNIKAVYFGNPLADMRNKRKKSGDKILLLPGSRKQEIVSLFSEMNNVAENMKNRKFILRLASRDDLKFINHVAENIEIDFESSLEEISEKCSCAVAASGTVTLELALIGIPSVVIYKTSKINEFIAKNIINVKYVSLPNLVENREIYRELLQNEMNKDNIILEINKIENNYNEKLNELEGIREKLGEKNVIEKYSSYILEMSKNV